MMRNECVECEVQQAPTCSIVGTAWHLCLPWSLVYRLSQVGVQGVACASTSVHALGGQHTHALDGNQHGLVVRQVADHLRAVVKRAQDALRLRGVLVRRTVRGGCMG